MNDVNDQTDPKPIPHRKLRSDEDEYEVRHEQLRIRRQEVSKALDLILNLSEKENFHNLLTSSRDGLLLQLAPVIDKETPPTIIGKLHYIIVETLKCRHPGPGRAKS